jgi:hypothetical protein
MKANVNRATIVIAFVIAICADLLEIGLFPFFFEGLISPLSDIVDVVVCGLLTWLIGFHVAFIPSFLVKLIPEAVLAPTWTIAVLIATRNHPDVAKYLHGSANPQSKVVDVESEEVKPPVIPPEK